MPSPSIFCLICRVEIKEIGYCHCVEFPFPGEDVNYWRRTTFGGWVHVTASVHDATGVCGIVGPFVTVGRGTTIDSGSLLHNLVVVGDDCHISSDVEIRRGAVLQNHVTVASKAQIGMYCRVDDYCYLGEGSFLSVACHMGDHSHLLAGMRVASIGFRIPPNSVWRRDVRAHELYRGSAWEAVQMPWLPNVGHWPKS